ncbi:MAG: DUF1893 domain-containing protein [Chloroflexi bacterium]|nr:DUF1893 domain-containing protein [Chloroflexota bacterium]
MYGGLFEEFLASADALRIYQGLKLVFSSTKDGLLPLMEYTARPCPDRPDAVVFDKVMGNAAALLSINAGSKEVFSPVGSRPAIQTLAKYAVAYHLTKIVPYIRTPDGQAMCPMEKLSLDKTPAEFYALVRQLTEKSTKPI